MKIENIPMPGLKSKGRPAKYDFASLPVVTATDTPCMTIENAPYHAVYACAARYSQKNPGTVFRVERAGKRKIHVWRTK